MRTKLVILILPFLMAFNSVASVLLPSEIDERTQKLEAEFDDLNSKGRLSNKELSRSAWLWSQLLFLGQVWSAKMPLMILLPAKVSPPERYTGQASALAANGPDQNTGGGGAASGDGGASPPQRRERADNQTQQHQQHQQEPRSPLPLPQAQPSTILTIIFDMDETLVANRHGGPPIARPYAQQILKELHSKLGVELVLWTASDELTANEALEQLGIRGYFHHLIVRHRVWYSGSSDHSKRLESIGRPLDRTVIIENSLLVTRFNKENAILVPNFEIESGERPSNDGVMVSILHVLNHLLGEVRRDASKSVPILITGLLENGRLTQFQFNPWSGADIHPTILAELQAGFYSVINMSIQIFKSPLLGTTDDVESEGDDDSDGAGGGGGAAASQ